MVGGSLAAGFLISGAGIAAAACLPVASLAVRGAQAGNPDPFHPT
jgi:hypothetical protein